MGKARLKRVAFCQLLTFGAHECCLSGFAAITAAFIKGQTLLSRPSHHLCVVREQAASRQRANAVDSAGVGVGDEQSPRDWIHSQEVLMSRVVTADGKKKTDMVKVFTE